MSLLRLSLAVAGLIVAVVAVTRDDRRIGWVAIVLLALGLAHRLYSRRR